jgi:hypothetical protein
MRRQFICAVVGGLAIGLGLSHLSVPQPILSQEAKGTNHAAGATELDSLKASASAFEKAYNVGDAGTVSPCG